MLSHPPRWTHSVAVFVLPNLSLRQAASTSTTPDDQQKYAIHAITSSELDCSLSVTKSVSSLSHSSPSSPTSPLQLNHHLSSLLRLFCLPVMNSM
ncbi:hypothetical protein NEOLEDRAFT_868458 [Neolentinus lepideus HHB14362 ss-1]|uniref:REJ domain-containing protein n=1 Tax=Neolentinus lepideus HHB14362 ss-1 TaxID=1314782 RepID=A0A165P308_9AGAM|nr:hypothetical protein NEOLEDRAFT_868458 [Neolentinus lepideus HHB14362 ss-1]